MNGHEISLSGLPKTVKRPDFDPRSHKTGIVHLGLGAFHKAHQAFYTDLALGHSGGDWRIHGVSLRNTAIPKLINDQNGLFTLLTRSGGGTSARIVGSIAAASSVKTDPEPVLNLLASADTQIVSITVTEKGYGIDRENGGVDLTNPVITHDLENPHTPGGVLGLIVEALRRRRKSNIPPFTVMSCDNLPDNGRFVKQGVVDFAARINTGISDWIVGHVPFPATMVDRITPAQTEETVRLAKELTGYEDKAAVETEPFHQWVIEDAFSTGRPDWDKAGAIFTREVAPFEHMKLRLLNGSHSLLAYAGFVAGHRFVRDCMADSALAHLTEQHMATASATVPEIAGMNLRAYRSSLLERFANPQIAHETFQIATDGSQKMPQRIFAPAYEALEQGQHIGPYAFVAAAWMRYCRGTDDVGKRYTVHDPRSTELASAACRDNVNDIVAAFSSLSGLIPQALSQNIKWKSAVETRLQEILANGMRAAIKKEASRSRT